MVQIKEEAKNNFWELKPGALVRGASFWTARQDHRKQPALIIVRRLLPKASGWEGGVGVGNKEASFALYYQIGKYLTELRCLEGIVSVIL